MIGDSPRHFYVASQLDRAGFLAAMVIEKRESRHPDPPAYCDAALQDLFRRHFRERDEVEFGFFNEVFRNRPQVPTLDVTRDQLNGPKTHEFISKHRPGLVLSYGVHKLDDETLSIMPGLRWNSHGGLSPWYRGVITHFWPTYMLEPQMTGMTLHELTAQINAGPIIHQTVAPLERGDGVHHTACRAVELYGKELPEVIKIAERGQIKKPAPQKTSGKLWLLSDWRPEHLRTVYNEFENQVVNLFLDGKLGNKTPQIVRQFEGQPETS